MTGEQVLDLAKLLKYTFGNDYYKFINKHFFTREHCLTNGSKSIELVKPSIIKKLKNKYKSATFNHIYMIDNNLVLNFNEIRQLIYCPTYDHTVLINPLRAIKEHIKQKYHNKISEELLQRKSNNVIEMYKLYYDKAFKEFERIEKTNLNYINDNYWEAFASIVNNSKIIDDKDKYKCVQRLQGLYMTKDFINRLKKYIVKYI